MFVDNPMGSELLEEDRRRLQRSVDLDPYRVPLEEHLKQVDENKEQLFVFSWSEARIVMLTAVVGENLHIIHVGGNILNSENAHELLRAVRTIAEDVSATAITATVVNEKLLNSLIPMGFRPIAVELKLEV